MLQLKYKHEKERKFIKSPFKHAHSNSCFQTPLGKCKFLLMINFKLSHSHDSKLTSDIWGFLPFSNLANESLP